MTSDDVLVVWQSTSGLLGEPLAAAIALLSDDERERCEQLRFATAARDYAAAHALLRRVLSLGRSMAPRDWRFARTPAGKPFLISQSTRPLPSFSLSHTPGLVACAVSEDEVGVDVESTSRDVDIAPIADRFFSAEESLDLRQLDGGAKVDRFFDFWLLKEALVKALGRRLSTSVRELSFRVEETSGGGVVRIAESTDIDPARWQFRLFVPAPGYRGAIAARHQPGRPRSIAIVNASELVS